MSKDDCNRRFCQHGGVVDTHDSDAKLGLTPDRVHPPIARLHIIEHPHDGASIPPPPMTVLQIC